MLYGGTYQPNKRAVIMTAPDCLVYLNGQLSLPSGGNPTKRVNIQPYVTSVSTTGGIESSPGNSSVSMHIPYHATDDFFRGGQLILTTMMEVRIYVKGHFLVGGAPRYYPVFWGIVTSVSEQWSGGELTVDLACQDILYWWTIQRININPSYLGASTATQGKFNVRGSGIFTGKNPFDVMYSLSRYAYGDSVNANVYLKSRQQRVEPNAAENLRLMAYWTRQWGRIAYALRMYGPNGDLIQGDLLAAVLSKQNREAAFLGRGAQAARGRSPKYEGFEQGGVDFSKVSAFSEIASRIGSFDLHTSEFQTKKEIADTAKQAIGYEFFMDTTGELVFKPPFYNLDVIPNKPVSWIRPIDVISESYAENPPDVTVLEATGNLVKNLQLGEAEITKPKATYVDYRLVAKYGYKPGTYNSEFFGAGVGANAARNLFYHLVDEMDRQNARVHTGQITIPIRSELRLGYPMFIEHRDCYMYVESLSHTFSYGGNCTTSLTLMAKRQKFYAPFQFWSRDLNTYGQEVATQNPPQPEPGETADPHQYPTNLYARPLDPRTNQPVADANVILAPIPQAKTAGPKNTTHEGEPETEVEEAYRDLVSFRTQFNLTGRFDYKYQIDPQRDSESALQSITVKRVAGEGSKRKRFKAFFPVSDERGYEVLGGYAYGRGVRLTQNGMDFSRQGSSRARALVDLAPDVQTTDQGQLNLERTPAISVNASTDPVTNRELQIDPNNYGRRLFELSPEMDGIGSISFARGIGRTLGRGVQSTSSPNGNAKRVPDVEGGSRRFKAVKSVARWRPLLDTARKDVGVSADQYPDDVLLSFIHTESLGRANARRNTKDGTPSQYTGLLQIGRSNAAAFGKKNTDFQGTSRTDEKAALASLIHFLKFQERYKDQHKYDADRMAMLWKGGPGTTKTFNRLQKQGASDSALVGFLSERWNTDRYISHIRDARQIWGSDASYENPPELLEEEFEINVLGFPPEPGDLELQASNQIFARQLQLNLDNNIESLPSNFRPVRDPSVMESLNEFLQEIYQRAFDREATKESYLRSGKKDPNGGI